MKIIRVNGSYRYKAQRQKRIFKTVALIAAAAVAVAAAVFAVIYFSSHPVAVQTGNQNPSEPLWVTRPETSTFSLDMDKTVEISVFEGEMCKLTVPDGVDIRAVTFKSGDDKVVRVDSAGRADAVGKGKAKVTAVGKNFAAECDITVSEAEKDEESEVISTAFTANEDILESNREKGTDDLYNITVNRRTNTVTVYTYNKYGGYDVPVRAMVCSCGRGGTDVTPVGDYAIYFREAWHPLYGDVYGMYVSGIDGPYLFHSVPYYSMKHNDLETEEFNKLGANASQGCVRLMASDVRWIYKNCPLNTPVKIIDADSSADPLGRPNAPRIDESVKWDPTDPNKNNPYKGKKPEISGAKDLSLKLGESFDMMKGIKAKDICGNDITDRVTLSGEVIADKPGTYNLTYSVTDDFHLTTKADITVTVEKPE